MGPALIAISLRQWRRHRLRTLLTITGIMLGVAAHFSIRTANLTLTGSLKTTVEKLAGKANLQVSAGESGFPESILDLVRESPGVRLAEPVIEVVAHTALKDEGNLLVLGVDTMGDQSLREYQFDEAQSEIGDPLVYLAQPDSILITRTLADRHGLKEGDRLPLFTSQGRKDFIVRGIFKPVGVGEVFGGNLAVVDVYSAQAMFNRGRNFDRIDMITDPAVPLETVRHTLSSRLPSGIKVDRPSTRGQDLEGFVSAFSKGLALTSFIALLVGVFIIFNAFSISVNQRWKEIGVLRALGATRSSIQRMFLGEAFLMGLMGAIGGIIGGYYLARLATQIMVVTVTTVYGFSENPSTQIFRLDYALQSMALGMVASLMAAWLPARAAARLDPALALHNIETRRREAMLGRPRLLIGISLAVLGLCGITVVPPRPGLLFQYGPIISMLIGLLVILPQLAQWLAYALRPVLGGFFGTEGLLAVDTMIYAPRRTSATVGALMIGLMFVFSTSALTQSYRQSIIKWMDRGINADIFVSASENARSRTYHFNESIGERIAAVPGVRRLENVRFAFVPFRDDNIALISIEMGPYLQRVPVEPEEGTKAEIIAKLPTGEGISVSRNFSALYDLHHGDIIRLETPSGPLERPIVGVVEDYSSEKGTILMDRELYIKYWHDRSVDFFDVTLQPDHTRGAVKAAILKSLAGEQRLFVFTNQEYKDYILKIVNQFFVINYLQMFVAIIVAVIGIINTLIISVSDRKRELGVLRAIGGLRRQVRRLVLLEAVSITLIGIALGALAGVINTLFLTRTVAFLLAGWTIPFYFPLAIILGSVPFALLVALGAAWWPAEYAVRLRTVEAISYE
ncbi:MAG: ABC transporter permease [Acidobacteria bacterium]|nr:ABC transporter permease [Acidobacteriota bacterium]MBI3657529.1 ABC transporter permease [Acidobacteriota bacterium]